MRNKCNETLNSDNGHVGTVVIARIEDSYQSAGYNRLFSGYTHESSEGGWYGVKHTGGRAMCIYMSAYTEVCLRLVRDHVKNDGTWNTYYV